MPCECQSGRRILQLTAHDLKNNFPELFAFAPGDGWTPTDSDDAVQTVIGGDSP